MFSWSSKGTLLRNNKKGKNKPENTDQVDLSMAEKRSRKKKKMNVKAKSGCHRIVSKKSQRGAVKAEMARKRILTTSFLDGKINKEFTNAISEKSYGAGNRLFCMKKREVGEERKPLFIGYYFKEYLV